VCACPATDEAQAPVVVEGIGVSPSPALPKPPSEIGIKERVFQFDEGMISDDRIGKLPSPSRKPSNKSKKGGQDMQRKDHIQLKESEKALEGQEPE
jgi:hypothetical protein